MASSPLETFPVIDRTQPLLLVPSLDDKDADSAVQQQSKDSTNEHNTLYVTFEPPAEAKSADSVDSPADAEPARPAIDTAELVQTQALELAANRAEIARHQREQEALNRAVRLRDSWLEELRTDLKAAKDERKLLTAQLNEARAKLESMTQKVAQQQTQIASLEAQVAERMGMTAFASDEARTRPAAHSGEMLDLDKPAKLEPLDDDSPPFVLNRKVMTVGRTRDNDVCVPSALVSRDHARILVSQESVVMFDVGSINGCFVNDELTRRHTLRNGDIVRFADRRYRFSV
jgi:hypothetical protein